MEKKQGISQEGLKLIACVTMLIDHIGATFVPWMWLRVVGRIAFPIYCFLLAEGAFYTRNPRRYGTRLAIGALLAELPFELLFFGSISLSHSSVMVTLFLGFIAIESMKRWPKFWPVVFFGCAVVAEALGTDYGGMGVMLMVFFALTRERSKVVQTIGVFIICWMIGGFAWQIGPVSVPMEIVGAAAMVPICLYSGRKATHNKAIQWAFYLFYPVHLTVLLLIAVVKYGYLI